MELLKEIEPPPFRQGIPRGWGQRSPIHHHRIFRGFEGSAGIVKRKQDNNGKKSEPSSPATSAALP
jgi:hypothetical protein